MARYFHLILLSSITSAAVLAAASCSDSTTSNSSTSSSSGSADGGATSTGTKGTGSSDGGSTGTSTFVTSTGSGPIGPFNDFPADPVVDASAPANSATLFGPGGSGNPSGGPCLFEPEPDTLYPNNWVRPRFTWTPAANENLFEVRLHTTGEVNDLVVYTASPTWTMPKDMWTAIAGDIDGVPITVTIRGADLEGGVLNGTPSVGSSQTITIAPAAAAGAIVYWTTSNNSALKGFSAGDETVVTALLPGQIKMPTSGGAEVSCVGCHTSTPDGKFAGFTAQGPWGNGLASVEAGTVGDQPPFLSAAALQTLDQFSPLGIQSYSGSHWSTGDHVMITPFNDSPGNELAWVDLEATKLGEGTSYGFFDRTGDTNDVGAPTISHDGTRIVYVSTNAELTGRLDKGIADLVSVPYNARKGGAATKIPGASDPNLEEYYPAFSPDDAFLAFNRIPSDTNMYNQPLGEVFVIPSAGGDAKRIVANDPPACTGKTSPGITNSWPKWAPQVSTVDGKKYYWLVFSSTRDPNGNPQLYVTGVVVDADNTIETHGALYIWNQPSDENNHTPAWDDFQIPPSPPPQ